jgi:ABC-type phosphate/phosphonate transport system substrate-binding protein
MKIFFTSFLLAAVLSTNAQMLNPVQWSYTAKKIADKTYEVHLTATIQNTWHLYSQTQPADAINQPTEILFKKNPLIVLNGKIKEVGKMELFKDEKLKISANQYAEKVDFVQKVKLKSNTKTNLVGSLEYQTCDNKKCLPPKKIDFTIALK